MTVLPELEDVLTNAAKARWPSAAAQPSLPRRPRKGRVFAISAALAVSVGAGVAMAQALLPTGDPLPVKANLDSVNVHVLDVRAEDPEGGPPWGVQSFEVDGAKCLQVGRIQGATFGAVGADGRFHAQPPGSATRGCGGGTATTPGVALGVIASAGEPDDLRAVRFGVAGPDAASVAYVPADGPPKELELSDDGAYLLVTHASPPVAGELVVTYDDGEVLRSNLALPPTLRHASDQP